MTAQQALLTPQPTSLGPSADDLIALTGFESISKGGRQQLIELIEKRIDTLQYWQKMAQPGTDQYELLVNKLKALRLKRLEIYNTFHTKIGQQIQVGAA
ncbi:hypothetical protein [Spirosoma oryzicola]|uniref:hypothetical protein n=1 Tax=Spirosoma oryzicola TaxID=2898794 RepID=UPI001E44D53A|nr:hypothetical protein [Spirosoma oryzicola]UHG93356.1 hypothetical protein LQ777_10735 [Spirosoma oryzicola]